MQPTPNEENEYGDFEEVEDEAKDAKDAKDGKDKKGAPQENMAPVRARMPSGNQLIGIVIERLGGKRMSVKTTDNKIRNCRVPGRFSRKFWLRPGNLVMIEPWPDDDDKGDVVYQYRPNEMSQLRKQGILAKLEGGF